MATNGEKKEGRVIIVSNRLPLSMKKVNDSFETSISSGGLVTALSGISHSTKVSWYGWPGVEIEGVAETRKAAESLAAMGAVPVFLDKELANSHYNDFSNAILWPILHYQSGISFREDAWKAYQRVNEIFADTVAKDVKTGDLIWVHDYHLMLVPTVLRSRLKAQGKSCPVGFTFHTPFPAADFWRALPVHKELLSGVLASDIIGFHTDVYKRSFVGCCLLSLGACAEDSASIEYDNHKTQVDTYIVGIDPEKFTKSLASPIVQARVLELEKEHSGKVVILGVDRLDYTKGIVQKFRGYDYFLEHHDDWKEKVTLIQIAIPSREGVKEYQELEEEVCMLVGRINGKHSTPSGAPLIYIHHSVSFTDLTALYRIADACLICSRRDGMNLVASEYIACQKDKYGVLVLSELAGAADFMKLGSVTFHPSSIQQLSNAIYEAVTMSMAERKQRYSLLEEFITTHTSARWGEEFVRALAEHA